jgi:spore maturation protein CgeB
MMDDAVGADELGLQDGVTCVRITEKNVMEKIDYYLRHDDERERIAHSGYIHAMQRHSCYARAIQIGEALMVKFPHIAKRHAST